MTRPRTPLLLTTGAMAALAVATGCAAEEEVPAPPTMTASYCSTDCMTTPYSQAHFDRLSDRGGAAQ